MTQFSSGYRPVPTGATHASDRRSFLLHHLVLPGATLGALIAIVHVSGLDQVLAAHLYAWQGHTWRLQHAFLTEQLIHIQGRALSLVTWLAGLFIWCMSWVAPRCRSLRRPLAGLLVSTLLSVLVVACLKSVTHIDCPWDLTLYGGDRTYAGLLDARLPGAPLGACFPAGHASGGYAWVALYYFFLVVHRPWRWLGLATGIGLGLVFGISQQVRGAHFLSHDLWTAAICWFVASMVFFAQPREAPLPLPCRTDKPARRSEPEPAA